MQEAVSDRIKIQLPENAFRKNIKQQAYCMNIDIIENDENLRIKTRPLIIAIKHVQYQAREL